MPFIVSATYFYKRYYHWYSRRFRKSTKIRAPSANANNAPSTATPAISPVFELLFADLLVEAEDVAELVDEDLLVETWLVVGVTREAPLDDVTDVPLKLAIVEALDSVGKIVETIIVVPEPMTLSSTFVDGTRTSITVGPPGIVVVIVAVPDVNGLVPLELTERPGGGEAAIIPRFSGSRLLDQSY